jgi:DNA (cytosine-5)-methyltransferase 1
MDRTEKVYTMVSLFSGAMGLDIGLERTGAFKLLACVEKEPAFRETIARNIKAGRVGKRKTKVYGDINELDPVEFMEELGLEPGELDLLVGGPPCQAFSTAGRRRSVEDPRGSLLWRFLEFVRVLKPRAFLMENVRGVVSAALRHRPKRKRPDWGGPPLEPDEEPGSLLRAFVQDLHDCGDGAYRMDGFEVNSVNYGAPQIRERLLCFGNRLGKVVEFPKPTHVKEPDEEHLPWRTLREALEGLDDPDPELLDFSARKKSFLAMVPPGSNWRSLPKKVQRESMGKAFFAGGGRSGWWRRLTLDLPCPTLVTMPNHASTSLCHPTETRVLSLKEYARVQEFPDNWEFSGRTSEKYCQIGNAVPVRLGQVAGDVVIKLLAGKQFSDASSVDVEPFRLVYVQSHIRTRKWFENGKVLRWKDGSEELNPSYSASVTLERVRSI